MQPLPPGLHAAHEQCRRTDIFVFGDSNAGRAKQECEAMSDNAQFWKDLLGDDYENLLDIDKSSSSQNKQVSKPAPAPQNVRPAAERSTPTVQPASRPSAAAPSVNRQSGQAAPKAPNTAARGQEEDDGIRFRQYSPAQLTNRPGSNSAPAPQPKGKGDDFEVDFDFDGEYRDAPNKGQSPPPPRGTKKSGCFGGILYAVLLIAVSLLLASLLWLAATDVLGLGKEDERVQVTVPEGFTIDSISDTLYDDGLIRYKFLFKLYAGFSNAKDKISEGTYELNKNYDYRALVNGMNIHGGKRVEVDVTIPEGYTLQQIFELLDANNVCTKEELWEAAADYDFDYEFLDKSTLGDKHRLEGYLFPDTYSFYAGSTPESAISKMLTNFQNKFKAEYVARADALGYSISDIVTIASMIEKEAGDDSERDLIASVIYNRLKSSSFPYLQIDATIYYAISETGEAFSTDVDSPYNTYNHKGLPAGPISNPGIASIKAALYPKTTSYYYYALNKSKTHDFFKDAASFNAFISSDKYGG
jgi:UPF0755 protein